MSSVQTVSMVRERNNRGWSNRVLERGIGVSEEICEIQTAGGVFSDGNRGPVRASGIKVLSADYSVDAGYI